MQKLLLMVWLIALSMTAHAGEGSATTVEFEGLQEHCVQVGEISFGANGRWADCKVTRGRWVSTMGLIDIYQAQYCLGDGQTCDNKALVLFGNRAYTKDAKVLLLRIDNADTTYRDPRVVVLGDDYVMSVASQTADAAATSQYYLWQKDNWKAIDGKSWQRDLAKKLPKDTSVREALFPDLETMSAHAKLYKKSDADCCPTGGEADIFLDYSHEHFSIKNVHLGSSEN